VDLRCERCRPRLLGSRQPRVVPVQSRSPPVTSWHRPTSSALWSQPNAVQDWTTAGRARAYPEIYFRVFSRVSCFPSLFPSLPFSLLSPRLKVAPQI